MLRALTRALARLFLSVGIEVRRISRPAKADPVKAETTAQLQRDVANGRISPLKPRIPCHG
jgi:hypothetical protein